MIDSSFRARATIDLRALKKNLSQVSAHCSESQIVPVIKANAYGHGVEKVALALNAMHTKFAALAVAFITHCVGVVARVLAVPLGLFDWVEAKAKSQEKTHRFEV